MAPIPNRFHLKPGDTIHHHFKVLRLLGEGTYGMVYQIQHSRNPAEEKAIKILKLYTYPQNIREEISKRFEREYECGKIKSKYLVEAIDKGVLDGNPYFLMEFCRGGSAKSWVGKAVPFERVTRFSAEVIKGLDTLHKNGVIHRDLKPDNILFTDGGVAKLTDFGIAGYQNSRMTRVNLMGHARDIFGTYAYIAPEQARNAQSFKSLGPMTDYWSLGVTLFEIISGKLPFGELVHDADLGEYMRRASKGEADSIRKHRPDTPNHLVKLIQRCLQANYKDRISSTEEAINILGKQALVKPPGSDPGNSFEFNRDLLGLQVMHGDEPGRIYNLSKAIPGPAGRATLGWYDVANPNRNTMAIVEKETKWISRWHATIEKDPKQKVWLIRDGQRRKKHTDIGWYPSTNGTLVNGQEVDQKGKPIMPGDIITIGDTTLKVIFKRGR